MAGPSFITNNFGWKVLSLVLAALSWYVINSTLSTPGTPSQAPDITSVQSRFPEVPVALMTAPGNTSRYQLTPEFVSVEVSGTEQQVKGLQLRHVHAFVDLTDADNEALFRRTVQVQISGDCRVTSVTPTSVAVERISPVR